MRGSDQANPPATARLFQHRLNDPSHRPGAGILWRQREFSRLRTDGIESPELAKRAAKRLRRIPIGRLASLKIWSARRFFWPPTIRTLSPARVFIVDAGYANAAVTEDGFRPAWGKVWGPFEIPRPEQINQVPEGGRFHGN